MNCFPVFFLDSPFGYALAEGLQFLFIYLEFRGPVAFLFHSPPPQRVSAVPSGSI